MKATPFAAFALILAGLCAFWPGSSSAQQRGDVYAVSGVRVDAQVSSAANAQTEGFAAGQQLAFERLARRLIPSSEQARPLPAPQGIDLDRMVRSVDLEEQPRTGGGRYLARMSVRFDPDQVRTLLQSSGFTVIETRGAPMLVAPTIASGGTPDALDAWREAWTSGGFGQELVPLAIAPPMLNAAPDWASVETFARSEAAGSALFATLSINGQSAVAQLVEVGPNNLRRDRGAVSTRISGNDSASLRTALNTLALQASAQIQDEWKARSGSTVTTNQPRSRVSATALYSNERQWEQIKDALEGAAGTVISEIRIEAVGREGALVSFTFAGDPVALGEDLNRRGVSLEDSPTGPVLRAARR